MSVDPNHGPRRPYRMRRRLDGIEETRRRITAAAFELHASVGPSRTSVKAIAERAGVQRHTVYAHFPDLDTLYVACTVHGIRTMGMPDPSVWPTDGDPAGRLRRGLAEVYAWYGSHAAALELLLRDEGPSDGSSAASDRDVMDPYSERMAAMVHTLAAPWGASRADRGLVKAVVVHALAFDTWRSLSGAGVSDESAVDLMVALVEVAAAGTIGGRGRAALGRLRTSV